MQSKLILKIFLHVVAYFFDASEQGFSHTPMCTPQKKFDTNLHPGQKKIAKETAVSILF